MTTPVLQLTDIDVRYGDIGVLHGVSLSVDPGQRACLIGSNGAGKSTLLNAISGVIPAKGAVLIDGKNCSSATYRDRVASGIIHVPEGRRLFAGMSVKENLLMGAFMRRDARSAIRKDLEFVLDIFPRLRERLGQDASTMSGGEQQMCAIGRGIMARPSLLMIDELSLGLSPKVAEEISQSLLLISRENVALLVVEQDVFAALEMTEIGFVLDEGKIALQGSSEALLTNTRVRDAYLGEASPI
jgi:branched-chain amino acid transport system ATP-binding protein